MSQISATKYDGTETQQDRKLINGAVDRIENDRMNMAATALALAELIAKVDTPFTIAIRGDWGTGKTSVLNMTRSLFEQDRAKINNRNKKITPSENIADDAVKKQIQSFRMNWADKIAVARFNPWADSELVRTSRASTLLIERFIRTLRKEAFIPRGLAKSLLVRLGRPAVRFAAGSLVSALGGRSRVLENEIDTSKLSSSLDEAIYADTLRAELVKALEHPRLGKKRIVFFIDDLDRIDPKGAVHILDTITSLLSMPRCVFVLAVDQEVLLEGISERYQNETYSRNYFDKTFNLSIKLSHTLSTREIKGLLNDRIMYQGSSFGVPKPVHPIVERCSFGNPRTLKKLMWLAHFRSQEMSLSLGGAKSSELKSAEAEVAAALAAVENAYPSFHKEIYGADISDFDYWSTIEQALENESSNGQNDADDNPGLDDHPQLANKRQSINEALKEPEVSGHKLSEQDKKDIAEIVRTTFGALVGQLVDQMVITQEDRRENESSDPQKIDTNTHRRDQVSRLSANDQIYQDRRRSGWMATYVSSQLVADRKRLGFKYSYPQGIARYVAREWSFASIRVRNYAGYLRDYIDEFRIFIGAQGFEVQVKMRGEYAADLQNLSVRLSSLHERSESQENHLIYSFEPFNVGTPGAGTDHPLSLAPTDLGFFRLAGWKFNMPLREQEEFEDNYDLVSKVVIETLELCAEVLDDRR